MSQELVGVYPTVKETIEVLHRLKEEGHKRHQVTVLVNENVEKRLPWNIHGDVEPAYVEIDKKTPGFVNRLKEIFYNTEKVYQETHSKELLKIRDKYRQELIDDKIVVLFDKDAHKKSETEIELDRDRSPLSTVEATDYERAGYERQDRE